MRPCCIVYIKFCCVSYDDETSVRRYICGGDSSSVNPRTVQAIWPDGSFFFSCDGYDTRSGGFKQIRGSYLVYKRMVRVGISVRRSFFSEQIQVTTYGIKGYCGHTVLFIVGESDLIYFLNSCSCCCEIRRFGKSINNWLRRNAAVSNKSIVTSVRNQ